MLDPGRPLLTLQRDPRGLAATRNPLQSEHARVHGLEDSSRWLES